MISRKLRGSSMQMWPLGSRFRGMSWPHPTVSCGGPMPQLQFSYGPTSAYLKYLDLTDRHRAYPALAFGNLFLENVPASCPSARCHAEGTYLSYSFLMVQHLNTADILTSPTHTRPSLLWPLGMWQAHTSVTAFLWPYFGIRQIPWPNQQTLDFPYSSLLSLTILN